MEQPTPTLAAILAEIGTPQLFDAWMATDPPWPFTPWEQLLPPGFPQLVYWFAVYVQANSPHSATWDIWWSDYDLRQRGRSDRDLRQPVISCDFGTAVLPFWLLSRCVDELLTAGRTGNWGTLRCSG